MERDAFGSRGTLSTSSWVGVMLPRHSGSRSVRCGPGTLKPESPSQFPGNESDARRTVKGLLRFTGAVTRDPAIDIWLDQHAPELGVIARTWFRRMRECGPDVRELMHDGYPTACIADAPFGYVGVFRAHVNVGFFYGAELPDALSLLEGSGKRMRHVKLRPGRTPDAAALAALVSAAYADIRARLATE
jgi:hypothetical protein